MSDLQVELVSLLQLDRQREGDAESILSRVSSLRQASMNLIQLFEMIGITTTDEAYSYSEFKYWVATQLEQMNTGLFIKYEDYDYFYELKKLDDSGASAQRSDMPEDYSINDAALYITGIVALLGMQDQTPRGNLEQILSFVKKQLEMQTRGQFIYFSEYDRLMQVEKYLKELEELNELEAAGRTQAAAAQEAEIIETVDKTQQTEQLVELQEVLDDLRGYLAKELANQAQFCRAAGTDSFDGVLEQMYALRNEASGTKREALQHVADFYRASLAANKLRIYNRKVMHILSVQREGYIAAAAATLISQVGALRDELKYSKQQISELYAERNAICYSLAADPCETLTHAVRGAINAAEAKCMKWYSAASQKQLQAELLEYYLCNLRESSVAQSYRTSYYQQSSIELVASLEKQLAARDDEARALRLRLNTQQMAFYYSVSAIGDVKHYLGLLKSALAALKVKFMEASERALQSEQYHLDDAVLRLYDRLAELAQQMKEKEVIYSYLKLKQLSYYDIADQLASERQRGAEIQHEIARKTAEIEQLQEELSKRDDAEKQAGERLNELESELESAQAQNRQHITDNDSLRQQLSEQTRDIALARSQIINTEQLIAKNRYLELSNTGLQNSLQQTQAALEQVQRSCQAQSAYFSNCQHLVDAAQQSNSRLVYDLQRVNQAHLSQPKVEDELEKLCDHFTIPRSKVYQHIYGLVYGVAAYSGYIKYQKASIDDLERQIKAISAEKDVAESRLEKFLQKTILPQPEVAAMRRRYQDQVQTLTQQLDEAVAGAKTADHRAALEKGRLEARISKLEKEAVMRYSANFKPLKQRLERSVQVVANINTESLTDVFCAEGRRMRPGSAAQKYQRLLELGMNQKLGQKERLDGFVGLVGAIRQELLAASRLAD